MSEFEGLISNLRTKDVKLFKTTLRQLGDLGDVKAVPYLLEMVDRVQEEDLLESILWTLSRLAPLETLITLLKHSNEKVVLEVIDALGRREMKKAVDNILPFLKHKNLEIRAMATWALGRIHEEKTYKIILDLLMTDDDPLVRANAAWAIGKYGKPESITLLKQFKESETDECVIYNVDEAIDSLEDLKDPWKKAIKVRIYECPKREPTCTEKQTQTENKSDQFIRIEFILCTTCPTAQICQIYLMKK
ncbi:MAG TPA: HEAT repeat domain-containing protein [Candidatus Deferrimicrobium sp.]|nr:HEAT repeat domain-containing protein [Candidatus Deferrimicrobium sp.]